MVTFVPFFVLMATISTPDGMMATIR